MTDRIFLDGMRLRCRIGITAEERKEPQEVIIDMSLFSDLSLAGGSDDIGETINYRTVMERTARFVSDGEFRLLEHLAEGVAYLALDAFGPDAVTVRARKAKYSNEPSIGVEIERKKKKRAG